MLLFLCGLFIAGAAPVDRIAAVVNDEVIALSEVYELGSPYIKQRSGDDKSRRNAELQVLDSIIMRTLVAQELLRLGMAVTQAEIEGAIADVAKANGLPKERLKEEVIKSGLSWEQYLQEMKQSLRQMKFNRVILQPRISVDEDALLDMYTKQVNKTPEKVRIGAIFMANPLSNSQASADIQSLQLGVLQPKIDQVKKLMSEGQGFPAVAAKLDEGGFGSNGGEMGTFSKGELRTDLDQASFSTEPGQLSKPLCDLSGCYLLYVFERIQTKPPTYESMRAQLLDKFYASRFERETKLWVEQARQRATIEIKLVTP